MGNAHVKEYNVEAYTDMGHLEYANLDNARAALPALVQQHIDEYVLPNLLTGTDKETRTARYYYWNGKRPTVSDLRFVDAEGEECLVHLSISVDTPNPQLDTLLQE